MADFTRFFCGVIVGKCVKVDLSDLDTSTHPATSTQTLQTSAFTSMTVMSDNLEEIIMPVDAELVNQSVPVDIIEQEHTVSITIDQPLDSSPSTEEELLTYDSNGPETELQIIHRILVACKTGDLEEFINTFQSYPRLLGNLNKPYICSISFDDMPLTLLQLSCLCNKEEIMLFILSQPDVDVNTLDPMTRSTALHIAVCMENPMIVHILCNCDEVDINLQNIDGKTAMQIAIERQLPDIVEIILTAKHQSMNWYQVDEDGNNIFHIISYHPNEAIILLAAYAFNNLQRPLDGDNSLQKLIEAKNAADQTPHEILYEILNSDNPRLTERRDSFSSMNVPLTPTQAIDPITMKADAVICMRVFDELLAGHLQDIHDDVDIDIDSDQESCNSSDRASVASGSDNKFGKSYTPPRSTISQLSPNARK